MADGLANGVRGIIQKIIINEDGAVNTILVKFDNEGIRQKAKASSPYKARHAHKRLYTVLPKYSKIQVLPGITSCRLMKTTNKQLN